MESNELVHYGVKGMRWGQRKASGPEGVPFRTNRAAKKDAEEFTRAKLFYGEGAGTRRKLIKAKVEANSKRDPAYKKAFDHHVGETDLSKRAAQARSERRRKDVSNKTRKGFRGTVNVLNGNSQAASATTAFLVGGALYAHKTGIDKMVLNHGKKTVSEARKSYQAGQNKKLVDDLLKRAGFNQ